MNPCAPEASAAPVFIPYNHGAMFGVITSPLRESRDAAVVLLWEGGGELPGFGKNRLLVRLARRAAREGFHVLQFDRPGVGDSFGESRIYMPDEFPDEIGFVCRWLETQGLSRLVLIGACGGARYALTAAERVPGVCAVALVAPPVRARSVDEWDAIAAEEYTGWASPSFIEQIRRAIAQRLPLLVAYGEDDLLYREFTLSQPALLDEIHANIEFHLLHGQLHGDPSVDGQDRLLEILGEWLSRLAIAGVQAVAGD